MTQRILYILLFLLMRLDVMYAQTAPTVDWRKKMGGKTVPSGSSANTQRGTAVCIPLSGGSLIAGNVISGSGDVHGYKGGLSDGWLLRLDEKGDTLWTRSYGGSNIDRFATIIQARNGDFIIGGTSGSDDGDLLGIPGRGSSGIWLLRLDSAGNLIRQNRFGGPKTNGVYPLYGYRRAIRLLEAPGGDIVVASTFDSAGLDIKASFKGGNMDIWLFAVNASLDALQWQQAFGGSGTDAPMGFKATRDSGYIIAAYTTAGDGDVPALKGGADYWLIKTNALGELAWQRSYGGSKSDNVRDVLATADGGYLIAGQSNSTDGDVLNPLPGGTLDIWLLKVDSAGTPLWDRGMGTHTKPNVLALDPVDDVYALIEDIDGNYIIAAEIKGASGTQNGMPGNYYFNGFSSSTDGWLLKLSSDGKNVIWERNIGGSGFDYLDDIRQSPDGSYIFCGNTASADYDLSGFGGSGGASSQVVWVGRLNACPSFAYQDARICKGDAYTFGGRAYAVAGLYWDTLAMTSGCDSLIRLRLIVDSIAEPEIAADNNRLGTGIYSSYQWLDEQGNAIAGATDQYWETKTAGQYRVAVTGANGCADTSAPYSHTPVGLYFPLALQSVRLYPNPASGVLHVDIPGLQGTAYVTICTLTGARSLIFVQQHASGSVDISSLPAGIYFVNIRTDEGNIMLKITKV